MRPFLFPPIICRTGGSKTDHVQKHRTDWQVGGYSWKAGRQEPTDHRSNWCAMRTLHTIHHGPHRHNVAWSTVKMILPALPMFILTGTLRSKGAKSIDYFPKPLESQPYFNPKVSKQMFEKTNCGSTKLSETHRGPKSPLEHIVGARRGLLISCWDTL